MPRVRIGEKRQSFVSRAIPIIIKDKKVPVNEAAAIAHGMYAQYLKKRRKK